MNRKKEISNDIWDIMRGVYGINVASPQSEKQEDFINKVVDYIDETIGTRRKRQEKSRHERAEEFLNATDERKAELIKEEADAIAGRSQNRSKRK